MRAVRIADGAISLAEVPAPSGDGVRVRIRSAGICGSDLHMLQAGYPVAGTLGHEIAGVTDDGTPVAIEPLDACGACEFCAHGEYNLCARGPGMLMGVGLDGGMADEMRVPERCLVPLPTGARVEDASLVEPLAVSVHGLRRAGVKGGERVAVVGGGTIGLTAVAAAAASGAHVALEARHDAQREAGARLGAGEVAGTYPLVVDAAGTKSALERCVELCRPGGAIVSVASYWEGMVLPGFSLCLKEVTLIPASLYARVGASRDVDVAASILAANPEIARTLITHRFPLEGAVEAFETAADRASGVIKVVLEP